MATTWRMVLPMDRYANENKVNKLSLENPRRQEVTSPLLAKRRRPKTGLNDKTKQFYIRFN